MDTLKYLCQESGVWVEITTLLIPEKNDSDDELLGMSQWIRRELGDTVPLHFTAFHPDWKMTDIRATPAQTLARARAIALGEGLKFVYTGNVHDVEGGTTFCASCGDALITRDWHRILLYRVSADGLCLNCSAPLSGCFEKFAGQFGNQRVPVRINPNALNSP